MSERTVPDDTAARVALWRARHVELDEPPVLRDSLGLELLDPAADWRDRPDMHAVHTARNRASIVVRARFVEDELERLIDRGITQYVVLGAGLDTFAHRRSDLCRHLEVFEIDRAETQTWKRRRMAELGWGVPDRLRFVPVDFEGGDSWLERLRAEGFDAAAPTVVSSLGVAVYLTTPAIVSTLRLAAAIAPGSELVMSFMIPLDDVDADEQPGVRGAARGAAANGTPWLSHLDPDEITSLAYSAGFVEVRHVTPGEMADRWFTDRADGLRPSSAEHLLVART